MRWSFIQRVRRTVSAPKHRTKGESRSRRCAGFVFGEHQRPGIERTRVAGWQSQTLACGGGNGEAGVGIFRVRTSVFHRNRRRTWNDGKGGPLPTREGRGAQRNGPRHRGSRLSVLSGKPTCAPIGPRHPEISGGLRRLQRRVHRNLGAFWVVVPRIMGTNSSIERRGTFSDLGTARERETATRTCVCQR